MSNDDFPDMLDTIGGMGLSFLRDTCIPPLLKWPGGKADDLKILWGYPELFPSSPQRYFEPFVGGGAAWRSLAMPRLFANDLCQDLIQFYGCIRDSNADFYKAIEKMDHAWRLLHDWAREYREPVLAGQVEELPLSGTDFDRMALGDGLREVMQKVVPAKALRIQHVGDLPSLEDRRQNAESALKAAYYTHVRDLLNSTEHGPLRVALFYFIREFSFSSMFRYNDVGDFNVPYGGISYNKRMPGARVTHWKSWVVKDLLSKTTFGNFDFEVFLDQHEPGPEDFVFVDPPYDESPSTYDNHDFDAEDQARLASWLRKSKCSFMLVVKTTPLMLKLYPENKDGVKHWRYPKQYSMSYRDRNEQKVEHLVVYRCP